MFPADFSSDGRLFHILGPRYERQFSPMFLLQKNGSKIDAVLKHEVEPFIPCMCSLPISEESENRGTFNRSYLLKSQSDRVC